MKKRLMAVVTGGLALWSLTFSNVQADIYYWQPSVAGTSARINWPDTDGSWYNYNGHSYYLSGVPGELGNAYNDTAVIQYASAYTTYPVITGTAKVEISNLIVRGGFVGGLTIGNAAQTATNLEVSSLATFITSGTYSSISGEGYSYTSNGNYVAVGGNASVTITNANWHNLGQLELSGKNLRTGNVNNYTSFDAYGTLNITNGAVTNEQEILVRKGGGIVLSNSSSLVINSALVMSGTDNSISPNYEHSALSNGSLRLNGQSTLITQSATISYVNGSNEYDLYVSGSSYWENRGDLYLGNLDNSTGGVYVSSEIKDGPITDRFVNLGLLNTAGGANSWAELSAFTGYVQIKGSGTNVLSSGNFSFTWLSASNGSVMEFAGSIDAASGNGSTIEIEARDNASFSSGNLKMASGNNAMAYLNADRGSQIKVNDLSIASGASSSGTLVVSRTSTVISNNTVMGSGAASEAHAIIERNSMWKVNGDLSFASAGSGTLRIDNSELIVSGNMDVAKNAGSSGEIAINDRARLTVGGTLSFGDGNYPDLELNNAVQLGALASTKNLNVTINGTTTINGKNDYVGSTTIAFRAVAVLHDADAQFGRAGSAGVTNYGSIYFGNGQTLSTLTINGNYTGVATGNVQPGIHMTANMNGDSPIVDRIIITGNASGPTLLYINQTGKRGGPLNNDEIISVGGSNGAEFSLAGGAFYSGLYRYDLTTDGQNWYLTGDRSMAAANAILNTAGASAVTWFTQIGNLNKRLGEVRYQEEQGLLDYIKNGTKGGELGVDFWAKTYGQQSNIKLGVSGLGHFTDYAYGIDLGADKTWLLDNNNSITAGYFVGYGGNQRDFKRNGSGESGNYYTGFYGTWLNKAGWFADLIVKGQYSTNEFDAASATESNFRDRGSYKNWAAGMTLEAGKRFQFKNGFFVEPSLQASYLRLFNGSYESDVTYVKISDADILRLWGGARAGWSFKVHENGNLLQPYIRLGAMEQVSSGNKVQIGGDTDDTWRVNTDGFHFLGGLGLMFQVTDVDQLHLDYEAAFGDKYDTPWNINLGYRHQF